MVTLITMHWTKLFGYISLYSWVGSILFLLASLNFQNFIDLHASSVVLLYIAILFLSIFSTFFLIFKAFSFSLRQKSLTRVVLLVLFWPITVFMAVRGEFIYEHEKDD